MNCGDIAGMLECRRPVTCVDRGKKIDEKGGERNDKTIGSVY